MFGALCGSEIASPFSSDAASNERVSCPLDIRALVVGAVARDIDDLTIAFQSVGPQQPSSGQQPGRNRGPPLGKGGLRRDGLCKRRCVSRGFDHSLGRDNALIVRPRPLEYAIAILPSLPDLMARMTSGLRRALT